MEQSRALVTVDGFPPRLIFIARYVMMIIGVSTFSSSYFPLATMVLTIVAILLVEFQPFKQSMSHLTHIMIMFISFLALSHIAALEYSLAGENLSTVIWEILVLKIISVLIIQGDLFWYFSASFTV